MTRVDETSLTYVSRRVRYRGLLMGHDPSEATALVILLPDWRGLSALARDHAEFLASIGCAVLVADLYGDGFSPTDPAQVGPLVSQLIEHREVGVLPG